MVDGVPPLSIGNIKPVSAQPVGAQENKPVSTGDRVAKVLDDGYTVVKKQDGTYEVYDPNGNELNKLDALEYMQNLVENNRKTDVARSQVYQAQENKPASTGERVAKVLDDGYTVVKTQDGTYEVYDPEGNELDASSSKEYLQNLVAKNKKQQAGQDVASTKTEQPQNLAKNENADKNSKPLTDFSNQFVNLIKNRDVNGNPKAFLDKRNNLVRNENNQKMFRECLGDPNGPGLSKSGTIRLQDGTTIVLARKQDIGSQNFYWDVTNVYPGRDS